MFSGSGVGVGVGVEEGVGEGDASWLKDKGTKQLLISKLKRIIAEYTCLLFIVGNHHIVYL